MDRVTCNRHLFQNLPCAHQPSHIRHACPDLNDNPIIKFCTCCLIPLIRNKPTDICE